MLIYPQGLLDGERLAACSDEAQLHFPRLLCLANGYGRMELSEKRILADAYANFANKPTREQLTRWLCEYRENYLLLPYSAPDGSIWGVWCGIPDNALPKYKTALDNKSPAPPADALEVFNKEYSAKKRERAKDSKDYLRISETFGNFPKSSDTLETFPRVVVVVGGDVVGGVEEEKQIQTSPSAPFESNKSPLQVIPITDTPKRDNSGPNGEAEQVYEAYPHKVGKAAALKSIKTAIAAVRHAGVADPVEYLTARIKGWIAKRERDQASGLFVPSYPNPATWFNQARYDDPGNAPKPKEEYRVLSEEEAAEAWRRDFGTHG